MNPWGSGLRVWGLGIRVLGLGNFGGLGFRAGALRGVVVLV